MRESEYTLETPISYRKDFGQFFTPSSIAHLMAEWIMKDGAKSVLDPAFGLGVFYDEIKRINPYRRVEYTGYDIDGHILSYLNSVRSGADLTIINDDYLEADISNFDGIICNPPYMRFQKFLKRHDVLPKIEEKIGKKLVGYSNISSVFLVKALKELNFNGRLAFIMPFEFFNTGYGKEIKKSLLEGNLLKQIVIFSNEKDIFPDATTTVCILLCKNDGRNDPVRVALISDEDEIGRIQDIGDYYQCEVNTSDLPYNKKWTPIILSLFSEHEFPDGFCNLSLYGTFMRGIATGANNFFALKKTDIEELHLGSNNLRKCITKSPLIKEAVFTEDDFYALYNANKPVHCLDVKDHEKKEVLDYIKIGEELGYHERYLTKIRSPWYKIEHRKSAPIWFGVFNRGRLKVIRNFTAAINFTCFHSFYPNLFGEQLIDKLFVYLLSDVGQKIIRTNKRSYGNRLAKFEPGDLNDSLCPSQNQFKMIDNKEASKVLDLARTDEELSVQMSNQLIERIIATKSDIVRCGF